MPVALEGGTDIQAVWLIATVVFVSLIVLSVVVMVAIKCFRIRRHTKAAKNSPYTDRKDTTRRRKMSDLDRLEEDELQRQFMIRKSLAGRTSLRTDSRLSQRSSEEQLEAVDEEESSAGLKNDWKEFEAKLNRERTMSFETHPAAEPPTKPSVCAITVPAPARADWSSPPQHRTFSQLSERLSLTTSQPAPFSAASTNARPASHWERSKVVSVQYERLQSSED